MDNKFIPESAAEKVLELVDDEPDVFEDMPGFDRLARLVAAARREQEEGPGRKDLRQFLGELASRLAHE